MANFYTYFFSSKDLFRFKMKSYICTCIHTRMMKHMTFSIQIPLYSPVDAHPVFFEEEEEPSVLCYCSWSEG